MIPDGWRRVPLGNIAQVTGGKRLPKGRSLEPDPTPHPYIRVSDMRMGKLNLSATQYLPADLGPVLNRYRVDAGDLLISVAGTLGVICRVPANLDGANLTENADRISKFKCHPNFLFHSLMGDRIQKAIQSSKTTNAQPKLALDRIRSFMILLPPRSEQRRIADALETWDRAIETVEALIANARAQKQALMQQLLPQGTTPPKKRLPGFSGEWRETSLGALGETYGGLTGKSKNDFGSGRPFITYKNVFENGFVDPKNVELVKVGAGERQHAIRNGDILFTTSSETPEEVGMSSVVTFEAGEIYLNSFCFGFRPNSASVIRPNFAGYFFRSPSMRRVISALAQGSTRYNISKSAFLKLAFKLPQADEQDAIAAILGGCDAELLQLTAQLTALRQEKAALMQQLLTGKRRVKVDQWEAA